MLCLFNFFAVILTSSVFLKFLQSFSHLNFFSHNLYFFMSTLLFVVELAKVLFCYGQVFGVCGVPVITSLNYIQTSFLSFSRFFIQSNLQQNRQFEQEVKGISQLPNSNCLALVGLKPATFCFLVQYVNHHYYCSHHWAQLDLHHIVIGTGIGVIFNLI